MIETEDVLLSQERAAALKELVNPIKDLTKNWNVDITSELGRYMTEFDNVADNFAEAAMVIQGSAGVWGRKVEFLYSLVVNSLEMLDEEKEKKKKKKQGGGDDEDNGEDKEEDQLMFLEPVVIKKANNKNKIELGNVCRYSEFKARMPLCLAPLAAKDTSPENLLYSKKGEVLASRDDFTVNSCLISPAGFAALDIESFRLLRCKIKNPTPFFRRSLNPSKQPAHIPTEEDQPDQEISFNAPPSVHDDDDDDDGGALDCSFNSDTSERPPPQPSSCITPDKTNNKSSLISRAAAVVIKKTQMPEEYIIKYSQKLNLHLETKNKPFKKAVISKPSQVRKRKRNDESVKPVLLSEFLKKSKKPVKSFVGFNNILKKPICPENISKFQKIFCKETSKAKQSQRRLITKFPNLATTLPLPPEILKPPLLPTPEDDDSDHDADDFGGMVECNDDTFAPVSVLENGETNKQLELLTDNSVQLSYEDLVKQHVDKFTLSAKEHFKISELRERVLAWESVINPILEKEEDVAPYDVHKYSNTIITRLSECENTEAHFTQLVKGESREEICRLFLTSLMLTNSGNIELTALDKDSNCRLVNTQLFSDVLEGYVAPSADEPQSSKGRKRKGPS